MDLNIRGAFVEAQHLTVTRERARSTTGENSLISLGKRVHRHTGDYRQILTRHVNTSRITVGAEFPRETFIRLFLLSLIFRSNL